jgi:hypothetical protein
VRRENSTKKGIRLSQKKHMTLRQYNGKSVHFLLSDLSISQYSLLCEELCFLEKSNQKVLFKVGTFYN